MTQSPLFSLYKNEYILDKNEEKSPSEKKNIMDFGSSKDMGQCWEK